MLDAAKTLDINKWEMISLQTVFEDAVFLCAKDYNASKIKPHKELRQMSRVPLPPVYVDCGNTLFDKSGDMPKIRPNFLNFLIALKNGGYDVQLISHEPLKYRDILRDELKARGHSHRLFNDESGLSILRKEVTSVSSKGLILIDNDIFSVPIQIKRRIDPNDPVFIRELEAYSDPTTPLANDMRADVLWGRSVAAAAISGPLSPHP